MIYFTAILQAAGLLPAALSDLKTRTIPDLSCLPVLFAAVLNRLCVFSRDERILSLCFSLILFLVFLLLALRDDSSVGGGDIKLTCSLCLANRAVPFCISLLFSLIPAALYCRRRKLSSAPLAPFLLFGFGIRALLSLLSGFLPSFQL